MAERKRPAIPDIPVIKDPAVATILQSMRQALLQCYSELDQKSSKNQYWDHTVIFPSGATDGTYVIKLRNGDKRKVNFVDAICSSGTANIQIVLGSMPLGGSGTQPVSSTMSRKQYHNYNDLNVEQSISLTISSASSLGRMTVTIRGTYDLD